MRTLSALRWLSALWLATLVPPVAWASGGSCPQLNPGELVAGPEGKLLVTADRIDGASGEVGTLTGAVRVQLGDKEFRSDALQYDDGKRLVLAERPSQFRNQDYVILSRSASYDLAQESGIFRQSEFTLLSRGARGQAEEMAVAKNGMATLTHLSYTSCAPGADSWRLTASELHLDREEGMGTARNATLRLGPVPVLYTPYIQFPIDNERHTGLLFPTIGNSTRTGVDARWPIYLNLAPNYDAVLTPRLMSDRGTQLGTSARYLLSRGAGSAQFEYLAHDAQLEGRSRAFGEFQHEGLLNQRLSLQAHYAEASDRTYFEDLSFQPGLSTVPYLDSSARLVYQAPASYTVQALVQKFQPLAGTLAVNDPYQRLPELRFDGLTRNALYDTRLGLSAQATNFARPGSVQGTRQVVQPYLQWARDDGGVFGALQTDLHLTRYQLRDADNQQLDSRNRSLPIASADAGLRFVRHDSDGGLQLLEPRLFYLYAPYREQSGLPVFDAGQPDYDFPQLFARNRFIGEDRIADANQLTTVLSYRQLDPRTGNTRLSGSFGQIYRFEPSRVTVPGLAGMDRGSADYLTSGEWRISQAFSSTALLQVSPDTGQFSRTNLALRYREGRTRADFAYRYRSGLLEQFDTSFAAPLATAWRAAGRVRYSARDRSVLDALAGLEYETCCYVVRGAYRRYLANKIGRAHV
jgi:LPS-assembly protein